MTSQPAYPLTDRKPDDIIAFRPSGPVVVASFLDEAITLSRQLPAHGYVINLSMDRYNYLLGFCAAVIAGQCTLMPPNRLNQTLKQLIEAYPDSYVLDDTTRIDYAVAAGELANNAVGTSHVQVPEIPCDRLCAIAFTSGSTGLPAPSLKYWETLRTGSFGSIQLLGMDAASRINMLATVPPQHMWGLETSILLPLFAQVAVSHLTPFFPQDISDALCAIPTPRVLVSSPVHLRALLKSRIQLGELDRILCATAPLSRELAEELEQQFQTHVLEIFGCSESGILAVRKTSSETLWSLSDQFALENRVDSVLIRGQHLPEDVVMPDVVELAGKNKFRWLGRHQDMINVAGKRGSLTDLNRRLIEIPGVVDGVIFLPEHGTEKLAALVVAPGLESSDILEHLKPQIEPVFLPRPVYLVSALPRQETGKLSRKAVMELFEQTRKNNVTKTDLQDHRVATSGQKTLQ